MKAVILHAYSSTNSGDGLLVREALSLIHEAHPDASVTVFALDPNSFRGSATTSYMHPLTGHPNTPNKATLLAAALRAAVRGGSVPDVVRLKVREADLIVGVGGGYLRAGTLSEALKMLLVHYPQLGAAITNSRSVYLPQSVGPFRYGTGGPLKKRLAALGTVAVRDDRSVELLSSQPNVLRAPDTALLPLGDLERSDVERSTSATSRVGLVARDLPGTRERRARYLRDIKDLKARTRAELLLQASARGNDDDAFYLSELGTRAGRTLLDGTDARNESVNVVVSVRLHGAIQSIRNGVPAVHLSYERKGWGAFEDLGIPEFVHNAYDFDPEIVAKQARDLAGNSIAYWERIEDARANLRKARSSIVGLLQGVSA